MMDHSAPFPNGPTVDTQVNFWPAYIDMLTSVLMFFFLIYFVERNLNPDSLSALVTEGKRDLFVQAFRREFASEMQRGEVALTPELGRLQISFGEGILFGVSRYELRRDGAEVLRRLARVFEGLERAGQSELYERIQIEGHTDSSPQRQMVYPRDNWELSTARATEVMRFMTRTAVPRMDERKMSVTGYAATQPVGRDRGRNRRIDIRIFFSDALPAVGVQR